MGASAYFTSTLYNSDNTWRIEHVKIFSKIRCVTFDLDDTLWPCEPTITKAEQALYDWLGEYYPRVTEHYTFEETRQHRAKFGKRFPELAHNVTALRRESLAELADECNYTRTMADDGLVLFRRIRNDVKFFEDAFCTLDQLKNHFKIGAVTNGNADLYAIGASDKFDFVVTAEEAGAAKPNKKIFEYAQDKAQMSSHEIVYVGDAPNIDVMGAKNSGWRSIWFNPGQLQWPEDQRPDAEISKLSELVSIFT